MNLLKVVREVRLHLEENGRLSLGMLRRQYELDDEALNGVIEELVDVQGIAHREENTLVWKTAPLPPVSAPATLRTPSAYTPKHLADKILQSKSALEGERKQVTIMFADVKGSMELAEQLDPEQWHKILDRFFEILGEGVHRFEGTINQYTGDGIMALFGAPIAHEDHAQRACHAALHLRDTLRTFSEEVRRTHGVDFSARIGLNSGEVVVGKIGDDLRMDYTAQGHAVGLAQRMEALAQDGIPYLTKYTAKLVEGFFELENLGEFNVKGVSGPMAVYSLLDRGAARNRVERSDGSGLSPFIGRDLEMEVLKAAYTESEAGRGQVIGIVAGPGLGKSRLLREFSRYVEEEGGYAITLHCPSHSNDVPLSGFLMGMRDQFRIESCDTADVARVKIKQRFTETYPESMEFYPFICDFLGVPDPEHPLPAMSPEQRQQRLQDFQKRNLKQRTQKEFTVLIFEDLHWSDSVSEQLIEFQIEWTPTVRQMCICTYRPEYAPPWVSKSYYRQIPLQPLGGIANKTLIDDLLGSTLADSDLASHIQERCGGNPFFIEETIQSLAESGVLTGDRGSYTVNQPIREIPFPSTVQSVLDARIDRLADREKQLIQTASIIGRNFSRTILQAVVDLDESQIDSAIKVLKDSEFIFEEAQYPEIEYSFKHALTQDAAYASQLTERRKAMHALVAKALEEHFANQLDEKSALLAHHWEEAGEALLAIRWHGRAALWVGRLDLVAATNHWRSVRLLRSEAPDQQEAAELGIAACRQLLQNMCFRVEVDLDEARALLDEGKVLANGIGDKRSSLYLSMIYSRVVSGDDDVPTALKLAIENQRASLDFDDEVVQCNASHFLIDALWVAGRLTETLQLADAELARVPRHVPREEWLWGFEHYSLIRTWRSSTLIWMGSLGEAIEGLGEVVRLAEEDGTVELAAYAHHYAAEAHYFAGDADNALLSARQGEAISREQPENLGLVSHTAMALGYVHLVAGRPLDAATSMRNALDVLRRVDKAYEGKAACFLAIALLEAGDLPAAESAAQEAIALCRRSLRSVYEAISHGVVARALLRRDGVKARDSAETALAEAATLIERTGATTLSPALLEWRAELVQVLGDGATRKQLLREAVEGYEAIGAPKQAERLSKELDS